MSGVQKHRKLIRAMPPQLLNRYFDTLELQNVTGQQGNHQSIDVSQQNIATLNPFGKKTIEKSLQTYVNDLPSKKFLEKKITAKDLKYSSRSKKHSNADKSEFVSLARASRANRKSEQHSLVDRSLGKLKYASISKDKAYSGLDRYRRSSLSSPYTDGIEERRRAISRTHDTVTLKHPPQTSSGTALETGKRLYKQNRLDEAISVLLGLSKANKLPQCQYLLGLCYMNKGSYESAVRCFEELLSIDPLFKKNIYLLIGIAWKKLNRIESSIKILTRGLTHFEQYFDCLVYRGKLYLKMNMHEKAILDFDRASELHPEKGFPWIGKADALKGMGKIRQAIEVLDLALATDVYLIARLRRAFLCLQDNRLKQGLDDINSYLKAQQHSSQALYCKGLILKKLGQVLQAFMTWEEAVKQDTNQGFVDKSVEQMLKTKIQQRDFYQASHLVSRLNSPVVIWRVFIEATLLLMKKKYEQGIRLYDSPELSPCAKQFSTIDKELINQEQKARYMFLKPLVHTYRAYGYFSLNKLDKAMNDYKLYETFCKETSHSQANPSKEYNCYLIEAILNFPIKCREPLEKAIKLYPNKSEPYLYLSMWQIQAYLVNEEPEILQDAKLNLNKAVDCLPQLSNNHVSSVYYHRAVLLLYLSEFQAAVIDIDKAIEKSEDNIPKYFYLRGLIFACCLNYSQSIQDYTVCINLDASFPKAFIERSKCLQMEGNISEAFNDLQKYISLKPDDPLINQYAASLLFQNCAYSDCLIAISHSKNETQNGLKIKAKCHLLLGNILKSIEALEQFLRRSSTDIQQPSVDLAIMKCLAKIQTSKGSNDLQNVLTEYIDSKGEEGQMFRVTDMLVLRGCIRCTVNKFVESQSDFMSALSIKQIFKRKQIIELEVEITENDDQDGIGWTIGQVYYCLSVCSLSQKKYKAAYEHFVKALSDQMFRQEEWVRYKSMLKALMENSDNQARVVADFNREEIDLESCNTFMTRYFTPIKVSLSGENIKLPLILGYPDIEAPSLTPQFDHDLLADFKASIVQPKPEAPWIIRMAEGVVFTSDVQVFDNLDLSVTSVNPNDQYKQSQVSLVSEQSAPIISRNKLKQHFKLDDSIQKRLNRILQGKQ